MKNELNSAVTTPGKPCPGCGCPYPGDHTLDCQHERDEVILRAFETIRDTVKNLTEAVSGLHQIVQHQQKALEAIQLNSAVQHGYAPEP